MEATRTDLYECHPLKVTVEQYQEGPFAGMWFVRSQTFRFPGGNAEASVAHEQNNGPCGSEDQAFNKGFDTLKRFIDVDLARQKAVRDALRGTE